MDAVAEERRQLRRAGPHRQRGHRRADRGNQLFHVHASTPFHPVKSPYGESFPEQIVKRQLRLHVMTIGIVRKAIGRNKRDVNGRSLSQHFAESLGPTRDLRIFLRIYHIFMRRILHLAKVDDSIPANKQQVDLRSPQLC